MWNETVYNFMLVAKNERNKGVTTYRSVVNNNTFRSTFKRLERVRFLYEQNESEVTTR